MSFCASCGHKIDVAEAILKFDVSHPPRKTEESKEQHKTVAAAAETAAVADADPNAETVGADGDPPESEPEEDEDENSLPNLYKRAKEFLDAREYTRAKEIYTKIVTEIDDKEHAAHWGLYLVDERNFHAEEKVLQCFACIPFRTGAESIRREILTNRNLDNAMSNASIDDRKIYNDEAIKHAENIYRIYKEGIEGLTAIAERKYDLLCNTFETIGLAAMAARVAYPVGVGIKFISDKHYIRFRTNRMNMLHLDVLSVTGQAEPKYGLWHYRHVLMNPENGILSWSELRTFNDCNNPETIYGEMDYFHKIGYALLGLWSDKVILRTGNRVFYCIFAEQPPNIQSMFEQCYSTLCVPIVEDPDSTSTVRKPSDFYQVAPIETNFETVKKSKWIRKKKQGACYIATAVYGNYEAPEVMALRHFRDEVLEKSMFGRVFVNVYYIISPPLAKRLGADSAMTRWVRGLLDRIVKRLG